MQILKCPFIETRKEFGRLLDIHGLRHGVEIGVDRGEFSSHLLSTSPFLIRLYCVDPWQPYREIPHDRSDAEAAALAALAPYEDRVTILKATSTDTVDIVQSPVDFVYVDGAHDYHNVLNDLRLWWSRVRPGGILSGHDWDYQPVQSALHSFFSDNRYLMYIIPDVFDGTGGGSSKHPSWYVFKTGQDDPRVLVRAYAGTNPIRVRYRKGGAG